MITVSRVTKTYGKKTVVDDVDFEVVAGRVTGFVGPNGAGKSTTMRMMVGLTTPDSGEVRYAGTRYTDITTPARLVGSVLDAKCMHPGRSARNHLRAIAASSNIAMSRVDETLASVGLESAAKKRAGTFSLGMKQRLALAGALLGQPEVLLLDEPANGLDPDGIRWLRNYLRNFADAGGTVFISSHLISELSQFADDLVVIGGGRLLANDSIEAIEGRSERAVVIETPQIGELTAVLHSMNADFDMDGQRVTVRGFTSEQLSTVAFDNQIRIVAMSEVSRSLEDNLIDMTRSSAEFTSI